jgi:hypothetical protein
VEGTIQQALLSPTGKHAAVATERGVSLIDIPEGVVLRTLPGAIRLSWNAAGTMLALLVPERETPGATHATVALWTPEAGLRRLDIVATDLAWGTADSLFIATGDKVECWLGPDRPLVRTGHHGVRVSPDGLYSIRRGGPGGFPWVLVHDRSGTESSACVVNALGKVRADLEIEPFWVRSPALGHVLCVSRTGVWSPPDSGQAEWDWKTGIVDVMTGELLFAMNGALLGPSADGRSAWVYDGAWLRHVKLEDYIAVSVRRSGLHRPAVITNEPIHIRVALSTGGKWGSSSTVVHEVDVQEGDPIPLWPFAGTYLRCAGLIRVSRVVAGDRIELTLDPGRYAVRLPGDHDRSRGRFVVGRAPVTITMTGIVDASDYLEIQVPH